MVAGPEEFYKYAVGQPITHPGGNKVKITKPLDWGATTEHAEYLGVYPQVLDPNSPVRKHAPFLSETIKAGGRADGMLTYKPISRFTRAANSRAGTTLLRALKLSCQRCPRALSDLGVAQRLRDQLPHAVDERRRPFRGVTHPEYYGYRYRAPPAIHEARRRLRRRSPIVADFSPIAAGA